MTDHRQLDLFEVPPSQLDGADIGFLTDDEAAIRRAHRHGMTVLADMFINSSPALITGIKEVES